MGPVKFIYVRERLLLLLPSPRPDRQVPRQRVYHFRRRERLLPRRPVNAYFLYTAPNSFRPKRTLRRYNPKMTDRDRMHVLYEMYDMFAPCPFVSCTFLVSMPLSGGTPGSREHPTISSMFRTSACLLLHRYLCELPEPVCCRGAISVSPPWHPFCSAMVTKCFITCSCQHFHKIA